MANKNYKGSLRLDWINKDLSLYYEIDETAGKGVRPVWVPKNDIRVSEPRILRFEKSYGDTTSENMLIKGDNLLVLRSLVEIFKGKPEKEKVKCIYIDPPFNTGNAFARYDDNLQHSEWLTMMRDRLQLLKKLLRKDGVIFVHIDNEEVAYLKILMDEVLGRQNFLSQISWERSPGAGIGQGGKFIINVTEYILTYAKDKFLLDKSDYLVSREIELKSLKQYTEFIADNGKRKLIGEFVAKSTGLPVKIYQHKNYKIEKIKLSDFDKNREDVIKKYIKNFETVFGTNAPQKENTFKVDLIKRMDGGLWSVDYVSSRGKRKGENVTDYFLRNRLIGWLHSVAEIKDGAIQKLDKVNDFWSRTDISSAATSGEGGVELERSKKPEALIERLLSMTTQKGDLVFDSFAGSGTTGAVAHKMGRRWLMVEMGRQAEELIIPRLQKAISGSDQTGISKDVDWQGGGGFKYYKLGESLINEQDMNWILEAEEMAEAIFLHFQYKSQRADWLEKENMYLGKHQFAHYHFALAFASREMKTLDEKLYEKVVAGLDKEKFKHLTIFTNVAVAVPPKALDERVLIKKIPATILREYNLL